MLALAEFDFLFVFFGEETFKDDISPVKSIRLLLLLLLLSFSLSLLLSPETNAEVLRDLLRWCFLEGYFRLPLMSLEDDASPLGFDFLVLGLSASSTEVLL